jgi:transcriptional regulator with XRE-family HTH domain
VSAKRVNRAQGEPSPHQEPTELRRIFARNLRHAREAAGLSKLALATAASCHAGSLGKMEAQATNATLDTIERLARALGLSPTDLLLANKEDVIATRATRGKPNPKEPPELRHIFARNLREIRLAAGLQQKTLAQSAYITLTRMSKLEVHAVNVTLDTVSLLAKHLGCSEIDLLRSSNA